MKRSPIAAFWLSVLPGVGHLYIGQFTKGLIFPLILSGIFNAIDRGADGLGILIPVYWLAVMLDAHRSAQQINLAIDRGVPPPAGMNYQVGNSWGWVLIGLGVIFTLTNFNLINFDWIFNLWPLALVALGVYVLRQPSPPPVPEAKVAPLADELDNPDDIEQPAEVEPQEDLVSSEDALVRGDDEQPDVIPETGEHA